jgi:hypothetical protein
MKPCLACTISKAKQKNVEKDNVEHVVATKEQLRMFVDFIVVQTASGGSVNIKAVLETVWR